MTSRARNAAESTCIHVTTYAHSKTSAVESSRSGTWGAFVGELLANGHEEIESKHDIGLFSFVKLQEGKGRANAHVLSVGCWVLDLDHATQAQIDEALAGLAELELAHVVYSTFQHKAGKPRLRVMGPLASPVDAVAWPATWRAIVSTFAPQSDEQCKDVSRMYFWPSCPAGADRILYSVPGDALDVSILDVAAPNAPARKVDLNAPELLTDGAVTVPRCPAGVSPFEHAETLCKTMPASVSGQGGHIALLRVARAIRWGLDLGFQQTAELIKEFFNPRCQPAWTDAEITHKVDCAEKESGAPYARAALLPRVDTWAELPLVVQKQGSFWLRDANSDDYATRCVDSDLAVVVRDKYEAGTTELYGDAGKLPKMSEIQLCSKPVLDRVTCYYQEKTTYDPELRQLVEGLRVDPELKAVADPDVEAWLAAMAGDRLQHLKMWIASTRADRLTCPARALAIIGKKEAGKSLIAAGLARIWNAEAVPAKTLCERFNGPLADCPILLADEQMPKALSGEDFRTVIQLRVHQLEPKGKEKHKLRGCIRMVIGANDINKVHLRGEKGLEDIAAIADRLCIIQIPSDNEDACRRAMKKLLQDDGSNADLVRIAQHFIHIQQTVEPAREGRFIGAPADSNALTATLLGETESLPELFDLLHEYFSSGGSWDSDYRLGPVHGIVPKKGDVCPEARGNFPIIVHDGSAFVRVAVIGQILGRELTEIRAALKPFVLTDRASVKVAGAEIPVLQLSTEHLATSLRCDLDALAKTLATDTSERIN